MFSGNSFAAKWLSLPGTDIKSKCPPNNFKGSSYSYASNCGNVVKAWSGAVWDDANRTMYLWGGGHGDYIGNEVYKLDISLTTGVTMTRITDPDIWPPNTFGPCIYDAVPGTNNPVSRHTYGNMAFLPARYTGLDHDKIWIHGGSMSCSGGGIGTDDWFFDVTTKTWTKMSPTGPNPRGIILFAAYHPGNNKIYMTGSEISASNAYFYSYDPTTNNWSRLYAFKPWLIKGQTGHRNATIAGDYYYFIGGGGLWKINVNGVPSYQYQVVSTTGATEIESANAPGITYDSKRNLLVAWYGSSRTPSDLQSIYTLNLSTLVWTKTTVTANAPTYSGPDNGTWGRFTYSSKMDCYVAVSDYNVDAVLYCPDDYPTDLWFSRSLAGPRGSNACENGQCKHIRMGMGPSDNLIYFFGGDHGAGSANSNIHTYNVDTDTWTTKIPNCATQGTVQLDGMDEGGLFYNSNDGRFYYFFSGNYCQECRLLTTPQNGCQYPNTVYDPNCTHGSCRNSAMMSMVNLRYDPISNTWDGTHLMANSPQAGYDHWAIHDQTLNKAFEFGVGNSDSIRVYTYDISNNVWSKSDKIPGAIRANRNNLSRGHWAYDKSARVVYLWDSYFGKIFSYNIATDRMSLISSDAPFPERDRYFVGQWPYEWDSTNNIIFMNECFENQTFPMVFHTYKPSTNTWQKNLPYNSWNGKYPWGRESFYDAVHNLYILLGYVGSTYGTNQIWFYRYGGGARTKPSTDTTPPSTLKEPRKTP